MRLSSLVNFLSLTLACLALATRPLLAQPYPTQTITLVVAFPAGGFADSVARIIGEKLSQRLGQNVVVENRGGAGGNLAARTVAGAAADGHTVLVTTTALATNHTLYKNKGYNTEDLRAVAIPVSSPETLTVHPSVHAKTLPEFLALGKDKPLTYGSPGIGTGSYIAAEYFFRALAKVQTVHVPFPGGAPAINAVVGNHVPALAGTLPPLVAHINAGALRGIAIASPARLAIVPTVPTYAEGGFANFFASSWVGFVVPAKTDDQIVTKLNGTINEIVQLLDVQERLKKLALETKIANATQTAAFFKSEMESWGRMVHTLGLSVN